MRVSDAVRARRSVRAFKPDPVPAPLLRELLAAATRAPSGGNLQPWRVYALGGAELAAFKALMAQRLGADVEPETPAHPVYPAGLWEPFRSRRRETGALRYAALGLHDRDRDGERQLLRRNLEFFGAPVGLFFCIDRRFGAAQWLDLGLYMQTLMLLAVERGLDSCAQAVWANWPNSIADFLRLPATETVVAGMALGYRDEHHPLNSFRTGREPWPQGIDLRGFD